MRSTLTQLVARPIDRCSELAGDDLHESPGFYEYEKSGEEGVEKEPLLSSEEGTGGQNGGDVTDFEEHLDRLEVNRDGPRRRTLCTVGTACLRHNHRIVGDITIFLSCHGSVVMLCHLFGHSMPDFLPFTQRVTSSVKYFPNILVLAYFKTPTNIYETFFVLYVVS